MTSKMSHKDYFDLVKSIGESKSKQEEDRIITEEVRNCVSYYCAKEFSLFLLLVSLIS